MSFFHVKAVEWGSPPTRGNQIIRAWRVISISSLNHQNADEIDSAGDNLRMESDSQGNQCFACHNYIEVKSSFIETNDSSFFIMCLLSDCVIAFWTSPRVPEVACEDKHFFSMGRWGTSPPWDPPLPCERQFICTGYNMDSSLMVRVYYTDIWDSSPPQNFHWPFMG